MQHWKNLETHYHQSQHRQCADQKGQLISWAHHVRKLFSRFSVLRGGRIGEGRKVWNERNRPDDKMLHDILYRNIEWALTKSNPSNVPQLFSLILLFRFIPPGYAQRGWHIGNWASLCMFMQSVWAILLFKGGVINGDELSSALPPENGIYSHSHFGLHTLMISCDQCNPHAIACDWRSIDLRWHTPTKMLFLYGPHWLSGMPVSMNMLFNAIFPLIKKVVLLKLDPHADTFNPSVWEIPVLTICFSACSCSQSHIEMGKTAPKWNGLSWW